MAEYLATAEETKKMIGDSLKRIKDLGQTITPEIRALTEDVIMKVMLEGIPPKEALNLSSLQLEKIYLFAHNQFQAGKYGDALPLFNLLHNLDPMDVRYSFSIAACEHYMKDYRRASGKYLECITLDPANPLPYFHLYDCFMHLNQHFSAYHAILMTLSLTAQDPKYTTLKEKAILELSHLESYLEQELQNVQKGE